VTERIADPQAVCPFVALDDDRDHRAPGPSHSHRCFADSPAAPRALAHQAAYCLSGSFPGCPTFVDWARREAAPVRVEASRSSLRDAGPTRAAPVVPVAPAPPADRSTARAAGTSADWTAPPPWGSAAGPAASGSEDAPPSGPDELDAGFTEPEGAGSVPADATAFTADVPQPPDDTPAFLVGRPSRPAPAPNPIEDEPWSSMDDADLAVEEPQPARRPVAAPRRMPVGYAPVAPSKGDSRAGSSRQGRVDASAPSWEQPRHLEEYPTLKSRGAVGIPRVAVYALIVLFVGVGLFAAPFLLRGLGGGGEEASPTPAPSASAGPSEEPSPTPVPTPEQVVHVVKSGDTLSTIAATYGVTVDDILAANPSIKDPNKIAVGDKIVIPQPVPSEIVDEEITPVP
jgi:LysM repeat protein